MTTPTETALFGRGIAFPPRLDADGRLEWSTGHRSVRESIRIILTTEPGERLMMPSFGAGLRSFLFEPNVPATHRLIQERIQHAMQRWEPRVAVESIRVESHPEDPARALVSISYTLVATQGQARMELSVSVGGGATA